MKELKKLREELEVANKTIEAKSKIEFDSRSLRAPKALIDAIDIIANSRDISVNKLLNEIITDYVNKA